MSKKAKEQKVPNKDRHPALYEIAKTSSHTGNKPLTQSLYDANVMVTQKVRKAQESNQGGK